MWSISGLLSGWRGRGLRPAGAERSLCGAEEVGEHAEVVLVRNW